MATTSILPLTLGQAVLGRATEPDAPPPEYLRIDGECWKLVTDPAAVQAAQAALEARERADSAFAMAQYAPRIANRPPALGDAEGKAPGAGWLEYDPATQLLKQMWRWTGQAWEPLPMDPVMIPVIQIGTGTAGDLTADRLIVTGDFVARVAQILELSVENLIVTEGATINELVALSIASATAEFQTAYIQNLRSNGAVIDEAVIGELAANLITSGLFRTAEDGQRLEIDSSGIVMYGLDPDGIEYEMVRIGPDGDNLITAGDTTISPSGVQAPSGTFDELMVGGRGLEAILEEMPRGRVAQNRYTVTSAYSNEGQIRISTSFDAEPFRKYRVTVTPFDAQAQGDTVITYKLGWAEGGNISTSWSGSNTLGWAQTQMFGASEQQIPGIQADFTGNSLLNGKMSVALYTATSNNYGVRLLGGAGHPLVLSVDDMGMAPEDTGAYWTAGNGGGGDPTPPPPSVQKYVKTYNATGYRCYNADGSSAGTPDVVQGLWAGGPSRFLRRGGWTFPSMTGDLSGATVDKVEAYIYCNHTYASSGSTVNLALWGGVMKDNLSVAASFSMKAGTGRWVTLPSNTYAGFKSGGWAGTGVRPTSSSSQQYARFHPSSAKIRITYRK